MLCVAAIIPKVELLINVLDNIGDGQWMNLSEIEQARLSIAVAHYALNHIQQSQAREEK